MHAFNTKFEEIGVLSLLFDMLEIITYLKWCE